MFTITIAGETQRKKEKEREREKASKKARKQEEEEEEEEEKKHDIKKVQKCILKSPLFFFFIFFLPSLHFALISSQGSLAAGKAHHLFIFPR